MTEVFDSTSQLAKVLSRVPFLRVVGAQDVEVG